MKVMDKREMEVLTYSWMAFGNNIPDAGTAANEPIQNGYAAGLRSSKTHVDVKLVKEIDGTYLYVKNAGDPADVQKVLNYGHSTHDTAMNQFGTGFKTAMSYFNPSNDAWEFWTREGKNSLRAAAPYSDVMNIDVVKGWPFGEEFVSCVKVRVENEDYLEGFDIEELGFRYAPAIMNGLKLFFNGERVHPIKPCGKASSGSKVINVCGNEAKINYTTYELGEDTVGDRYYAMGLNTQGVYLFTNHTFSKYLGLNEVIKKSGENAKKKKGRPAMLQKHPSMNGCIAIVDIETPINHSADIPFDNTKCNVKWGSTEAGKAYRDAINDCVGEFFRTARSKDSEKGKRRKVEDFLCGFVGCDKGYYQEEVALGKKLRADAIISSGLMSNGKIDLSKTEAIIEYKNKEVKANNIGQLVDYYIYVRDVYNISPKMIFIADSIDDEALEQIARYKRCVGFDIQFVSWKKVCH